MTTYPETGRLSAPAESPLVIKNVRLYGVAHTVNADDLTELKG